MTDWENIKERFSKNMFTTVLGIVGGIAGPIAAGGGKYAIIAGICAALLGVLAKDPKFGRGE